MGLIEKRETNFNFIDERGELVQLVRGGYSQVNVVSSIGGARRGQHYHELNTEAFYIIKGKCRVTALKDGETETQEFCAGDFFRIGPYILHSFEFLEDSVLVSMYSLGVELGGGRMDLHAQQQ